jgi:hypothetical protein
MSNDTTYLAALEKAKLDLYDKLRQRGQIEEDINRLRQSIRLLGELSGANMADIDKWLTEDFVPIEHLGLTDAVRRAFDAEAIFTPVQLRDFLLNSRVGTEQVNLLASVHTVMKRLEENDEIERIGDKHSNLFKRSSRSPRTPGFQPSPGRSRSPARDSGMRGDEPSPKG